MVLPILFKLARELRDNQTEAEEFLWNHLESLRYLNVRFKRQHPILYFIADFYCHKAKLIIEVDGGYHDIPEQYRYDKEREYELEALGLKVIRFTNEQVMFHIENTLKEIEDLFSFMECKYETIVIQFPAIYPDLSGGVRGSLWGY